MHKGSTYGCAASGNDPQRLLTAMPRALYLPRGRQTDSQRMIERESEKLGLTRSARARVGEGNLLFID